MRNLASLAMLADEVCSKRIGLALKIATRWDRVVPGIALAHFSSPLRQRVREYGIKLCGGDLLAGLNVLRVNVVVAHFGLLFAAPGWLAWVNHIGNHCRTSTTVRREIEH